MDEGHHPTPPIESAPLKGLDDWDDFVATRYKPGKSEQAVPQLQGGCQSHGHRVLSSKSCAPNLGVCAEQESGILRAGERQEEHLGVGGVLEHAGGRKRSRHRPEPDRTPTADLRSDPQGWPYGEPQWAVVGDTFPVGCAYSDQVVFPEFSAANPDASVPEYRTKSGIYEPHCGLDKVHLSFGHDEYIYQVARNYLPEEGLYMLRYHSFYAAHRHGAYRHLMNRHDEGMFAWVGKFNPYDLFSKGRERPDVKAILPFY
jgi:inositol oxygenase